MEYFPEKGELSVGRTMTKQILEQKAGHAIQTGQVYFFPIDCVMTHDVGTAGEACAIRFSWKRAMSGPAACWRLRTPM